MKLRQVLKGLYAVAGLTAFGESVLIGVGLLEVPTLKTVAIFGLMAFGIVMLEVADKD